MKNLVKEALGDVLRPKSREEARRDLSGLNLVRYTIAIACKEFWEQKGVEFGKEYTPRELNNLIKPEAYVEWGVEDVAFVRPIYSIIQDDYYDKIKLVLWGNKAGKAGKLGKGEFKLVEVKLGYPDMKYIAQQLIMQQQ